MQLIKNQIWTRKPILLVAVTSALLIAVFSVALDRLLDWQIQNSIRRSAELQAVNWSERLFATIPNAEQLFVHEASFSGSQMHLEYSIAIANIIRFGLFDSHGHQTFISDSGQLVESSSVNETAWHVHQTTKAVFEVHDVEEEDGHDGLETYVVAYIPAISPNGKRLGTMEVAVDVSALEETLENAFTQVSWALILGTFIVISIPVTAYVVRSQQVHRKDQILLELTRYDQLTGIHNRNAVSEFLDTLFADLKNNGNIGVLFVDVDCFKKVNDQYGHACGDKLLQHIASILRSSVRSNSDMVGRYGGDEFIIVCQDINLRDFRALYGRIMEGAKAPCVHEDNHYIPSLSIGAYLTFDGDSQKTALHRADLAVYGAKKNGRRQVMEYSEDLEGLFTYDDTRASA